MQNLLQRHNMKQQQRALLVEKLNVKPFQNLITQLWKHIYGRCPVGRSKKLANHITLGVLFWPLFGSTDVVFLARMILLSQRINRLCNSAKAVVCFYLMVAVFVNKLMDFMQSVDSIYVQHAALTIIWSCYQI